MGLIRWDKDNKTLLEQNADGDWECVATARIKGKKFSYDAAVIEFDPKFRKEMIKRWNAQEKSSQKQHG